MEWNVYKVNDNIDLSNSFFDMLDGSEANHLNYLTLRPIRFYEILKELNSKDILRSDFKITPISISYFNPLKRRKDEGRDTLCWRRFRFSISLYPISNGKIIF